MEQVFRPVFSLVRKVPVWAEFAVFIILLALLWLTSNFMTMVVALVWAALRMGAEFRWMAMWALLGVAALLAAAIALGYPGAYHPPR
ncbi:hypothetical protein [Nitrospirillum viridazoti]|uniref:Uncharacterized protein n=2 Tax=Nitrospirillum TaxID=1543705 RepID=A0A560IAT7_9PROT|nr:hypothetical protein [Nitrospirillum amazonense]TWB56147.1 hypothetical protein FBZ92_113141 [Nitrospirillum amazonense]